jgi:hypothetical protein
MKNREKSKCGVVSYADDAEGCGRLSNSPRARGRACVRAGLKPRLRSSASSALVTYGHAGDFWHVGAEEALPASDAGPSLAVRPEADDRRTLDVSGRPGSSTRLRASQGPGPGDDDGAEDLGELDPNAPSTVSLYDAPLNPYRGGLLDLPETDEAETLARGYAGPERRRDATAAVTLQPPLHRGRNRRLRLASRVPPPEQWGRFRGARGAIFGANDREIRIRNPVS